MYELYSDIPRLYTAIAEWLACLTYCLVLKRRVSGVKFALISAGSLIVQSVFLVTTKSLPIYFWIPCMLTAALLMYLYMCMVVDDTKILIGYFCARAFLLAEFAASLEWQLASFIGRRNPSVVLQIVILLTVYALVYAWAYYMELRIKRGIFQLEINRQELLVAIIIAAAVFAFSNLSFILSDTPFSAGVTADVFYVRTLVDIAGIMVLYVYQSRICELLAEKELGNIQSMLKAQYDKYRNYQTTFDMINMKYHDLKHQIAGLRADMTSEERQKWIDTMEQELESYRPELQTGSSVLDTIIAGKMMTCSNNNIKITCVADGNILDFMHVADICTIFGNALDNAIESVSLIEDVEKRLIHLTLATKKNFVMIRVGDYCEGTMKLRDGYPVTTKADKSAHGFGIKSIKYTVEKYRGTVTFDVNKNWFELRILIPQPGEKQ